MKTADITPVGADALERELDGFAGLLHACVHSGASIGFILPHTPEDARAWWLDKVLPGVRAGGLLLLAARQDGRLVGTVQLDHDTPGNQRHRAEVRKLLVHPAARRQGLGRALMQAVEGRAAGLGRTLLTLDTRTGCEAEPLYRSLGFEQAGIIPSYCRDAHEDRLDSTTLMYKLLAARPQP
jgi:ribosomal protein S18 acetylase RimI-like enzyme